MPSADAYIIAVPIAFSIGYRPDLRGVLEATEAIADMLRGGEIIVFESICPAGTTMRFSELIAERRSDLHLPHVPDIPPDIHLAHYSECVLPGRIMIQIASSLWPEPHAYRLPGSLDDLAQCAADQHRPCAPGGGRHRAAR